jgi:hypothetical protein
MTDLVQFCMPASDAALAHSRMHMTPRKRTPSMTDGTIFRRAGSPFWWVSYVDAKGVPRFASSKSRSRAVAKAFLEELEAKAKGGSK